MTVEAGSIVSNVTLKIRALLASGLTDPISSSRPNGSYLVNTSWPEKNQIYPIVVIDVKMQNATRMGAYNSYSMEVPIQAKISTFANSRSGADLMGGEIFNILRNSQFSGASTHDFGLHDFQLTNEFPIDEPGRFGIHRQVQTYSYLVVI